VGEDGKIFLNYDPPVRFENRILYAVETDHRLLTEKYVSKNTERWVLIVVDALAFMGATILYYYARFEWGWVDTPSTRPVSLVGPVLFFYLFWFALFLFAGLYRERYAASRFDEIVSVLKVVTVGILILFFLIFIDQFDADSGRKPILFYWLVLVIFVSTGRITVRTIQKALVIRGHGTHDTLIVGWSDQVDDLYREVKAYPAAGFNVVGVLRLPRVKDKLLQRSGEVEVDLEERQDDKSLSERQDLSKPLVVDKNGWSDIKQAASLAELPRLIDELGVQDVLISLSTGDQSSLMEVLRLCDGKSVSLKLVPDFFTVVGGMARTEHLYGLPLIEVYPEPMPPWEQSTKRVIDILVATSLLAITLPIFIAVALAIRLTSRGPVIYRQQRLGRHGKPFTILKFRTMWNNAEAVTGPVWASENDPRYTPLGRWLRKTRLDELPQFWNVLQGSMSLVGPRPEREFFVEQLAKEIPLYHRRLRVKPGITGLAQVKWKYDESLEDVRQKVKYDLLYIENMSLKYDFSIFFFKRFELHCSAKGNNAIYGNRNDTATRRDRRFLQLRGALSGFAAA